jgi:hypothetical protein
MAVALDLSAVPNLPGYGYQKKKIRHNRNKAFEIIGGVRVEHQEGVTYEKPRMVKAAKDVDTRRHGSLPQSTTREEFQHAQHAAREHSELPAWDALDRHVLRFFGYFKEAVIETNLENWRVRKCIVFYYLEDDTCHIAEKKQDNSGIPQGTLIRRHRFPGPNGGFLTPDDISVGGHLNVYGRTIRVVDADNYTREFYRRNGVELEPAETVEGDAFGDTYSREVGYPGIPRTYERLYREAAIGGGHVNAEMQQFLEWDRKVCRFFAVQDDLSTPTFERRPFVLLFFLADDTVEIREQYPLNCGRDTFPIFFRRGRLPKGKYQLRGPMDQCLKKSEYIGVRDFSVGSSINLQGNDFFIYDADEFTRGYFGEELNMALGQRCDVQLPERTVPRPPTPPYTGFGSWDDSMTSVLSLLPKQPKKDFVKLFKNSCKILRFTSRFADPKPEDAERLFVVNFHLEDDTLSIHEPPQRNLGIVTGKFLEKAVHLNMTTGNLFTAEDLYPGAIISVHSRKFELLDCDEFTRRYYTKEDGKVQLDLGAVLEKIKEGMRQQFPLVRDVFRKFDTDKDGVLTQNEFKQALEKFGFANLTDEAVLTVMKYFDSRQDGQISYNEFCDAVLDEDYTTQMMKMKPSLKDGFDPEYARNAALKADERSETAQVRTAVRAMTDTIYKNGQVPPRLMKEFAHMTHEPVVSCRQIKMALQTLGKTFTLEEVQRTVLFVMPNADLEKVNYVEFLKAMNAIFHDMCRIR